MELTRIDVIVLFLFYREVNKLSRLTDSNLIYLLSSIFLSKDPYQSRFQIFSPSEIRSLEKGGDILKRCLEHVRTFVEPGVTTKELDIIAEEYIRQHGGLPAFQGYQGFAGTLCTSVNDAVVHGLPSKQKLKEGDIISLDCGVIYDDLYTDACITVGVGEIAPKVQTFLSIVSKSLEDVIDQIVCAGVKTGDIGAFIQHRLQSHGYEPVPVLTGHGLGATLHQFPEVPNRGKKGTGPSLPVGTMIAIEPIAVMGNPDVFTSSEDGWTILTKDGSLACHFEHSLLITEDGCEVVA